MDDEEDIGTLVSGIFRAKGYEVDCTLTSVEASQFLNTHRYAVIFLDINLGLSDGLDLIPEINATQRDTQVVVVSAYGDKSVREAVRKAGISRFILKPFSKNQILRSLEK